MTNPNRLPDLAYLQACFEYDPESGLLTWRERPLAHFADVSRWKAINKKFAGRPAGRAEPPDFYVRVKLLGSKFHVSRIIWKLVTGDDPQNLIDHRDLARANNRWINLRPATYAQNSHNVGISPRNTSGFKGVTFHKNKKDKKKWSATLVASGQPYFLGYYETPDEAYVAWNEGAERIHKGFMRNSERYRPR